MAHPIHEHVCLNRRQFLTSTAGGIGFAALATLLREDGAFGMVTPTFPVKAKNCIFFYCEGGPSQFDLFSYKPVLNQMAGQAPPPSLVKDVVFAFIKKDTATLFGVDPRWATFQPAGQSGMMLSPLLPNLAKQADRICLLNAVVTSQFNHHPGQLVMQTGNNLEGHPSMGSWLLYGLGSPNQNLPGYVVMNSSRFLSGGATLWGSGFLSTSYAGTLFQPTGNPILNLGVPAGIPLTVERRALDSLGRLNAIRKAQMLDPEISSRVDEYELSYRMQMQAPGLLDLSTESAATLQAYGLNRTDPAATLDPLRAPAAGVYGNFARHCLLARRMVEAGVRFVNVFTGSWDAHSNLNNEMPFMAGMIDQPIAALIADLATRGLLDETLLVFGSEFGRTPLGENRPGFAAVTGRDHHPYAFSMFLAGGGVKGGLTYGQTDDIGWAPVAGGVDVSDVHATILKLFGIDHMQLTSRYNGLDQRLTPVTRQATAIDALIA